MSGTGLSTDPQQYDRRLGEQSDDQIDTWAAEAMRDLSIRRGVIVAIEGFLRATGIDEDAFARVFAAGGGPLAVVGRTAQGKLMVPAVTLHCLVAGIRAEVPDGRDRLIRYLVDQFEELTYV